MTGCAYGTVWRNLPLARVRRRSVIVDAFSRRKMFSNVIYFMKTLKILYLNYICEDSAAIN
jgi:hypothetical protein